MLINTRNWVEMAGIEPASERFLPRTSTSVVFCFCRRARYKRQKSMPDQPFEPESSSFTQLTVSYVALRLWWRPVHTRSEDGYERTWPVFWVNALLAYCTRQQAEEKHSCLCDWHLLVTLIFRGRRLSARGPGPASSVEACHPRETNYIMILMQNLSLFLVVWTQDLSAL